MEKEECKFCGGVVLKKNMEKHNLTKKCIQFQNITYSCNECNFDTIYFTEITAHKKVCKKEGRINVLQTQINQLQSEIETLKVSKPKVKKKTPVPDFSKLTLDEICENIKNHIDDIKQSKNYSKILLKIKLLRLNLLKYYTYTEYKDYIVANINDIKNVFKQRKCDDKKIDLILKTKVLFPLELRLLYMYDFEKTNIEIEHIHFISECYEYKIKNIEKNQIFDFNQMIKYFTTYNICFIDIHTMIDMYVKNIDNIIYLDLPKSNNDDPFSFYYLENIAKKKKWRMDCRLDETISDFVIKYIEYSVSIFRDIYYRIFKDNEYRSNIYTSNEIFDYECKKIVKNLIIVSDYVKFIKYFQNSIIKYKTYTPTDNDNFRLKSDDKILKKQFETYREKDYTSDIHKTISLLFDNIKPLEIIEIYNDSIK